MLNILLGLEQRPPLPALEATRVHILSDDQTKSRCEQETERAQELRASVLDSIKRNPGTTRRALFFTPFLGRSWSRDCVGKHITALVNDGLVRVTKPKKAASTPEQLWAVPDGEQ